MAAGRRPPRVRDRRLPHGDLFAPAPAETDSSAPPAAFSESAPGWHREREDLWIRDSYSITVCDSQYTTPNRMFWTYFTTEAGLKLAMDGSPTLEGAVRICEQHRQDRQQEACHAR